MFSTGRIKRPHRGLFFPGGTPSIDWDNPSTQGLVGCYVPTGNVLTCLVTGNVLTNTYITIGTPQGTTAASIQPGPIGLQALDNDVGSVPSAFAGPLPASQQVQNYSVLWAGTIQGLGQNLGNGYPYFFGASTNNTGAGENQGWGLARGTGATSTASSETVSFNQSCSTFNYQQPIAGALTGSPSAGNYCFVGTANIATCVFFLFSNGRYAGTSTGSPPGPIVYSSTAEIVIGTMPGFNVNAQAGCCVGMVWDRVLTKGEAQLLSADPGNFLVYPQDMLLGFINGYQSNTTTLSANISETGNASDTVSAFTNTAAEPIVEGSGSAVPITLIANTDWNGNGNPTSSAINTTGASLLVMSVGSYIDFTATQPVPSDSLGNTWVLATTLPVSYSGVNQAEFLFYVANPTVGASHTFSCVDQGSNQYPSQQVAAFSGIATTSPLDQVSGFNTGSGGSPSTIQPGSLTPSQASSLIITQEGNFVGTGTGATATVDSGFTTTNVDPSEYGAFCGSGLAYLVQTSSSPVNPTWTLSSTTNQFDFIAQMVIFRGASVPGNNANDTVTAIAAKGAANSESGSGADTVNFAASTYVGALSENGAASDSPSVGHSTYVGAIIETGSAAATAAVAAIWSTAITETGSATATVNFAASTWKGTISESGSARDSCNASLITPTVSPSTYFFLLSP